MFCASSTVSVRMCFFVYHRKVHPRLHSFGVVGFQGPSVEERFASRSCGGRKRFLVVEL